MAKMMTQRTESFSCVDQPHEQINAWLDRHPGWYIGQPPVVYYGREYYWVLATFSHYAGTGDQAAELTALEDKVGRLFELLKDGGAPGDTKQQYQEWLKTALAEHFSSDT